jgi:hypothetical protein
VAGAAAFATALATAEQYLSYVACQYRQQDRQPHPSQVPPSNRDMEMNETCDRCGPAVLAVQSVERSGLYKLHFCRHCTNRLRDALSTQGRIIWPVAELVFARQAA